MILPARPSRSAANLRRLTDALHAVKKRALPPGFVLVRVPPIPPPGVVGGRRVTTSAAGLASFLRISAHTGLCSPV